MSTLRKLRNVVIESMAFLEGPWFKYGLETACSDRFYMVFLRLSGGKLGLVPQTSPLLSPSTHLAVRSFIHLSFHRVLSCRIRSFVGWHLSSWQRRELEVSK